MERVFEKIKEINKKSSKDTTERLKPHWGQQPREVLNIIFYNKESPNQLL